MNVDTRRAIVWREIERLAFRPVDRCCWLRVYERSLASLWQVEPLDVTVRPYTGFDAVFIGLECAYTVETPDKYSASISCVSPNSQVCLNLHVDPGFCSKGALFKCPTDHDYPRESMDNELERDVEYVLNGMLFHPRIHSHGGELGVVSQLQPVPPALSPKEIRLGGGIENAFVFLTHLRYQFCLLSDSARTEERARMVRLFTEAIRSHNRSSISAAVLFALRG